MPASINDKRYQKLRDHLKAMRMEAGLTQIELAEKLELFQSHISKVERGERYVDVLFYMDWARACGYCPSDSIAKLN